MEKTVYHDLQELFDTLPNGYPKAADELEIKILKKIYNEEEAGITLQLKINWETPDQIAERTGMDLDYLKPKLDEMLDKGQLGGVRVGPFRMFRLMPFVIGIYEYQLNRMDQEFVEMTSVYMEKFAIPIMSKSGPAMMRVIPVEQEIPSASTIEPYQTLTHYIENAQAWAVGDCICKKEKKMLGEGCDKPMEVCISIAPVPGFFDEYFWGRPITKEEAFKILADCEEAGLVHATNNVKDAPFIICNCCSCCCGVMRGLIDLGNEGALAGSDYYAVIDQDECASCGVCEERCHVDAIDVSDDTYTVNQRCIGCGLCVSTCPAESIVMVKRDEADLPNIPQNEMVWLEEKDTARGGSGEYKKLL